ncbi:uncharacterized protein JNUCC1_02604 [Lentibacillus sp. JNUCC-1]|uniref:DUF418 domain-containing protein n=1 Tax=Lentibacillus sp. JNUCC-1 TaxID=2654513 RepID=UPI0012E92024|nr:DUF418 domain-containing protein [Lentibacillus sp. JNUCC-1]MUV38733.1 uncharacterized protein [Lentibacillus sp. JNUCC-1]
MRSSPISQKERIYTIDIIRGFALFGIFLVNMPAFHSADFMKSVYGFEVSYTGLDYWVDVFFTLFVEMKFFTTFSFLFGLGFYIFMSRADAKGLKTATLFLRRMLGLLAFGVVHLIALWYGDILHTYAIAGVFLLFFYKRKIMTMLIWAASLLFVYNAFLGLTLLVPSSFLESMEASESSLMASFLREYVAVYENAGYIEWVTYRLGAELPIILINLIPALIPVFAMFLIGLAAGKAGIFHNIAGHLPLIKKICLITGLISLPLVVLLGLFKMDILDWGVKQIYIVQLLTSIGSTFMSLFYVSALTLVLRKDTWQQALRPLGFTGQMALTNYLMQTVIAIAIFVGFDLYGKVSLVTGTLICLAIFAVQMIWSTLWLKTFRFGPFEWLWRSFTYLKIQPLKK